ncbi:RMD1 family protein [Sedimenticola hydrogenitrophicus]|uniref:RMD1 family protein n=1 Tax=Sedimenticola hydrogenitrophicus TaxID=2967975 RepID=UPI0023B1F878|nr:RMD1 family protein [Sedimenticola hydrogenitrophicus]
MLQSITTVRSLLVGQGIELRRLHQVKILSRDPTTIEVEEGGYAVLFRFGVVVLFNVAALAEASFLQRLRDFVIEPYDSLTVESLDIEVVPDAAERLEEGRLILPEADLPLLQVVADILAKSLVLDDYEKRAAGAFDRIEPLAERMQSGGRLPRQVNELLRHVGEILQIQHRMVGRAQVGEKPDILWDHPELERIWKRLENEYEIGERQIALERKLDLISNTAETLLGLLQDRRTLRVEWYIVILIVVEIVLTLYELFFRHAE